MAAAARVLVLLLLLPLADEERAARRVAGWPAGWLAGWLTIQPSTTPASLWHPAPACSL